MSTSACNAVGELSTRLKPGERVLLMALADEADSSGNISSRCCTHQFLMRRCGWRSTESVRVTLKSLIAKGLLATAPERDEGPRWTLPFVGKVAAKT